MRQYKTSCFLHRWLGMMEATLITPRHFLPPRRLSCVLRNDNRKKNFRPNRFRAQSGLRKVLHSSSCSNRFRRHSKRLLPKIIPSRSFAQTEKSKPASRFSRSLPTKKLMKLPFLMMMTAHVFLRTASTKRTYFWKTISKKPGIPQRMFSERITQANIRSR